MRRTGTWVSGDTWKQFAQFHSIGDGAKRVLVDLSSVKVVEEVEEGSIIVLSDGGYAEVSESYDKVMNVLWAATSRPDLVDREELP